VAAPEISMNTANSVIFHIIFHTLSWSPPQPQQSVTWCCCLYSYNVMPSRKKISRT